MAYDGFLIYQNAEQAGPGLFINGTSFSLGNYSGSTTIVTTRTFPVSKGDSVYVAYAQDKFKARFYKKRDYSNR